MIWCQGRLLVMFIFALIGAYQIDIWFLSIAALIFIISIGLGYKDDNWD